MRTVRVKFGRRIWSYDERSILQQWSNMDTSIDSDAHLLGLGRYDYLAALAEIALRGTQVPYLDVVYLRLRYCKEYNPEDFPGLTELYKKWKDKVI